MNKLLAVQHQCDGLSHSHIVPGLPPSIEGHELSRRRVVVKNLLFYEEAPLEVVVIQLLHPNLGPVDEVIVEIAPLEHLKGEVLIPDDNRFDLLKVVQPDVRAVFFRPIVLSSPERDRLALFHERGKL